MSLTEQEIARALNRLVFRWVGVLASGCPDDPRGKELWEMIKFLRTIDPDAPEYGGIR